MEASDSRTDRRNGSRPPLDQTALERLAVHYVGRYATTRAKLHAYLARKLAERGVVGEVDPARAADRMVALGYVDDLQFARSRAEALARRGFGARRVRAALTAAGIARDCHATIDDEIEDRALAAALTLARRRRIGPFADERAAGPARERAFAILLRAGHPSAIVRRIVDAAPGSDPTDLDE